MASVANHPNNALRICSFNMDGFDNGLSMTKDLTVSHDIILLQEHWLLKGNLGKLDSLSTDFLSYGLSSMNAKSASGILVGRPFGGVGIL